MGAFLPSHDVQLLLANIKITDIHVTDIQWDTSAPGSQLFTNRIDLGFISVSLCYFAF